MVLAQVENRGLLGKYVEQIKDGKVILAGFVFQDNDHLNSDAERDVGIKVEIPEDSKGVLVDRTARDLIVRP